MQQFDDTLRDIRQQCRMAMNGVASTGMREKGLIYKLNFGLALKQIKDLTARYKKNAALAETLWHEGTRELKILATLLYPTDEFTAETANRWASELPNQEIREQVCLNLFQELEYAAPLAIDWANAENDSLRTTGYWLLARLFLAKKVKSHIVIDYLPQVWNDAASEDIFLRNAALLDLKHIGRQSEEEASVILDKLSAYKTDADPLKQEAYNSVAFEFEFYFGKLQ